MAQARLSPKPPKATISQLMARSPAPPPDSQSPDRFNEDRASSTLRGTETPDIDAGVAAIREVLDTLPPRPGVYRMQDARGDVLYVGKARALKNRVGNYVQVDRLPTRLRRMVSQTRGMTIVTTNSEADALLLEAQLIKRYRPPYNVLLRDDKSFPFILLRADHDFPRIMKHRGARKAAGDYYGPFAGAGGLLTGQYRKWNIKQADTRDDFAMMREVMTRRFARLLDEGAMEDDPDRDKGIWPDLELIDGGKGQMSAAKAALEELGVEDVNLVAIAKGPHHGRDGREVFHFSDGREKSLPVNSPVLFYLQNLRDEVHRFAIGAHRDKRSRAISASPLDEIPGIGPARKRALLLHFGTAGKVRAAALDDLMCAPGVSAAVAQTIYDFYHPGG